jgi:hypothetical protein
MVDVILSNEDLSILGGPETVNVEVDFGATGSRGSRIFVNYGQPVVGIDGLTSLAPDCNLFDLYINIQSTDDEYQFVYQYQNVLGTLTWVKLFKLVSTIHSKNYSDTSFVSGTWTKNIPVIDVLPLDFVGTAESANFNIQYTILGENPIASSLSIAEISTSSGALVLPLTIKAKEFVDGAWSSLSGTKTVQLFITMV